MRKLSRYIRPHMWYILLTLLIKCAATATELLIPRIMEIILDETVPAVRISGDMRMIYILGIGTNLKDLSFRLERGQTLGILGPTGAGKTTIINLLMRFYDVDGGKILVDGHDIRNVTRDSLRKAYTMVLQDTWLFHGTIFENIAYGKPDATMEEVVAAAKATHIHSYISRLP